MTTAGDREARQDVADVLVRYATGIDTRDWDLFRTCFTTDCHAHYEDIGTWDGVEAITDFMAVSHAALGETMHRISNIAVTIDGDTARARSYVDAMIMTADGKGGINPAGWYQDELVRTPDGWRIARRHSKVVHYRTIGDWAPPEGTSAT